VLPDQKGQLKLDHPEPGSLRWAVAAASAGSAAAADLAPPKRRFCYSSRSWQTAE